MRESQRPELKQGGLQKSNVLPRRLARKPKAKAQARRVVKKTKRKFLHRGLARKAAKVLPRRLGKKPKA